MARHVPSPAAGPAVSGVADGLAARMRGAAEAARAGRMAEAARVCREILAAAPTALEPQLLIAQIAASEGRPMEAIATLRAALRHHRGSAAIWTPLARLGAAHLPAAARGEIAEVARRAGLPAPLLSRVGATLAAPPAPRRARDAIEDGRAGEAAAIARDLGDPALLAEALEADGRAEEALAAHDARIAAAGDRAGPGPAAAKALLLQRMGRLGEAGDVLRDLIERHPGEGALYRLWATGERVAADDPLLARMERLWTARPGAELGFALAKALEDAGRHGEVFAVLHEANRLAGRVAPPDLEAERRDAAAWRAALAGLRPVAAEARGPVPLFVAGMPRSGTTLVERILARGAGVAAGGETGLLAPIVLRHARPPAPPGAEAVRRIAEAHDAALARRWPGASRVTDKSMQLWKIVPLLAALPGAATIVVRRDPRDTGLSIYQQHFAPGTQRFATDLRAIGRMLRLFDESVAHWREAAPGAFTEVSYDALVADPAAAAERLAAAAGLPAGALSGPDAEGGLVRTLSVAQARAPVHAGSSGRWRRFEAELAPLIEELER